MTSGFNNNRGQIRIDDTVIAKIAGLTAVESMGIVGLVNINVKEGLTKLLKGDQITKGIKVSFANNTYDIEFHVIVEYGVNIKAVTDTLISSVQYKIEQMTGLKVNKITIFVEGVRVDE